MPERLRCRCGYPDASAHLLADYTGQLCIVHMVRNAMKYVPYKDYKAVAAGLKRIYQSATEQDALRELELFAQQCDDKYSQISRS